MAGVLEEDHRDKMTGEFGVYAVVGGMQTSLNGLLTTVSVFQLYVLQTRTVRSSDWLAKYLPIGSHVMPFTMPEWPCSTAVCSTNITHNVTDYWWNITHNVTDCSTTWPPSSHQEILLLKWPLCTCLSWQQAFIIRPFVFNISCLMFTEASLQMSTSMYTVSQKITVQNCFCQNFIKIPPILIIFGRKMAKRLKLCKVHSFSTSSNSRHHTTMLNTDVPNCYTML